MPHTEYDIELISEEIHRYLLSHPDAADTIEGITKWWLTSQRYEETKTLVKKALNNLISRGLIIQSTNADGTIIYSKSKAQTISTRTQ